MFRVQNKIIHISRTESGILKVKKKNNEPMDEFANTVNVLKVYNVEGLLDGAIVEIPSSVSADRKYLEFDLGDFTSLEEDDIEYSNEPVEYWYELIINDKIILGYDQSKAKTLILYPAGK